MCMCRKSEGPSELIGSEADKGGPLQKKNPGEMFTQGKKEEGANGSLGGGEREFRSGFQILRLFLTMFPSCAVMMVVVSHFWGHECRFDGPF